MVQASASNHSAGMQQEDASSEATSGQGGGTAVTPLTNGHAGSDVGEDKPATESDDDALRLSQPANSVAAESGAEPMDVS